MADDRSAGWTTRIGGVWGVGGGYYRAGRIGRAQHLLERGAELLRGPTQDDVPPLARHRLGLAKGRLDAKRIFFLNHDYSSALLALQPVADRAAEEGNPAAAAEAQALIGLTIYYRM